MSIAEIRDSGPPSPCELFENTVPGGGIGISFKHAAQLATGYVEAHRRAEKPLDESEIFFPEIVEDPIRKAHANALKDVAEDLELAAFASFKLDPDLESEAPPYEETIAAQVDRLIEEAKERAIAFKKAVAELGDKAEAVSQLREVAKSFRDLDVEATVGDVDNSNWQLATPVGNIPRITTDYTSGRIQIGDVQGKSNCLETADALHPDYPGLVDLRDSVVYHASDWVMRVDHPWHRWKLLQRMVRWGSSLVLFGLVTDPAEEGPKSIVAHHASRERLNVTRQALANMSSRAVKVLYLPPTEEQIADVVHGTTLNLRNDRADTTLSPAETFSGSTNKRILRRGRELQNIATTSLPLTDARFGSPALKGTLFRLETAARIHTGGSHSAETLATGPDAFEAALLGILPTLKLVRDYTKNLKFDPRKV